MMTRYEAMNTLEDYRDYILPEDIEALNMAIEALEALDNTPNTLQHVGSVEEGLISRQDVLGYIDRLDTTGLGKGKALEYIRKYVERSQSVDLVRCKDCKHGKVETEPRSPWEGDITCKLDGTDREWYKDDYCSYGERRSDERR